MTETTSDGTREGSGRDDGEGLESAGLWRRFIAALIEIILVPVLTLVLVVAFGVIEHAEDYADAWWLVHVLSLGVVSYLICNGYLLWRYGQTLGKRIMGIRIATTNGEKAPLWKLLCIRFPFFPLLYVLIGLLDVLFVFTRARRCIHDYAAGTIVVKASQG